MKNKNFQRAIQANKSMFIYIPSEMLTFLVAFTSSDVTVLQHLSKVRVMSVS